MFVSATLAVVPSRGGGPFRVWGFHMSGVPPGVSLRSGHLTAAQLPPEVALDTDITALPAFTGFPVEITGDYSDGTVLASVVAALVALGLCTDGTQA